MTDDDLRRLTMKQLEGRLEAAIKREREAEIAYNTKSSNLSENPSGQMPVVSMPELQSRDNELQSAWAEREAIEQEIRRRK